MRRYAKPEGRSWNILSFSHRSDHTRDLLDREKEEARLSGLLKGPSPEGFSVPRAARVNPYEDPCADTSDALDGTNGDFEA